MNLPDRTQKMRTTLRALIFNEKCLQTAFSLAWVYGDFNRLNFDRLRSDEEIVSYLSRKIEKHFEGTFEYEHPTTLEEDSVVHIMTEGYDHGGHSLLLIKLLKGLHLKNYKQKVIFTGRVPPKLKKAIKESHAEIYSCSKCNIYSVYEIVSQCLSYPTVILHIHPNDIFAAVAANILTKMHKCVMFVDHADHSFSFGRESCTVVLDVSAFGWKLNEANNELLNHSFLGIPIDAKIKSRKHLSEAYNDSDKGIISVLSVGRGSKYRPVDGVSFVDFLNILLISNNNIEISIVGSSGNEEWWCSIDPKIRQRVKFFGLISSDKLPSFYQNAEIYIDSFPVTGATTAMEAFVYGCNVHGLRFHPGGYNPIEYLYDKDYETIVRKINDFSSNIRKPDEYAILQKEVENAFSNEATVSRLIDALYGKYHSPPKILESDGDTYKVYEMPWLQEGQLRWPYRTFIKASPFLKLKIIVRYLVLNENALSFSQMKNSIFWILRSH